jgi:hypothetical protein
MRNLTSHRSVAISPLVATIDVKSGLDIIGPQTNCSSRNVTIFLSANALGISHCGSS